MKKKDNRSCWLIIAVWAGLLSSCQPISSSSTATVIADFIPPTQNPAEVDFPTQDANPLPTRQPNCDNQLLFLDDLTIPDGMKVSPGDQVAKRWLIRNDGSCNWNRSYSLQLISGLSLGAAKEIALYPARQSSEAVIEITFTAPSNPGNYNSWWQAYDPDGNRFGDPIFMEISVIDEE